MINVAPTYGRFAGGRVPYVMTPLVGEAVACPGTGVGVDVAVAAILAGPVVAVAGVVVRFGMGVSVLAGIVGESATAVNVSVAGTAVKVAVDVG